MTNGVRTYERLFEVFHKADQRYNSGLFHFSKEPRRAGEPDDLSRTLEIDDKQVKDILRSMYYPDSPYEFSVLSSDILGQVYEQFLGKVIRLTAGHRAVVEEKPEVKKAGGVYYTPTYIVDYIVRETVGHLLDGKTPKEVAGQTRRSAPLRIVDPACGSGSFLLGAYQHLLDWHRDRYVEDGPGKYTTGKSPVLYEAAGGDWRLTTAERKRILLTHIFGVDIDHQAVEVTKLSLLLKVLEGESDQTLQAQFRLFHERALPDLDGNVTAGNSLIGPEFYAQGEMPLIEDATHRPVNIFNWRKTFPGIFTGEQAGFDAVIGNPPYIRVQALQEWYPVEAAFYKRNYTAGAEGNFDIYVLFVERGLSLLSPRGRLGFILPNKFFNAQYGQSLRTLIAKGGHLSEVVHFGHQQIFADASTYTALLFLEAQRTKEARIIKVDDLAAWRLDREGTEFAVPQTELSGDPWNFMSGSAADLLSKVASSAGTMRDVASRIAQGIRTSANPIYVLNTVSKARGVVTAFSQSLQRNVTLEVGIVSSFLQGSEIKPYRLASSGKIVIVPYRLEGDRAVLYSEAQLRSSFPRAFDYLRENRDALSGRERGRMSGPGWYAYVYPKNLDVMKRAKILVPDIAESASFALDAEGQFAFASGYGIVLKDDVGESRQYVLALLNSRLLDFYLKQISTTIRGGYFRYFAQFIEQLPIRRIRFASATDVSMHDELTQLADRVLDLQWRVSASKLPQDRQRLERQIEATVGQIDAVVYRLYELTDREVKLVEGSGG